MVLKLRFCEINTKWLSLMVVALLLLGALSTTAIGFERKVLIEVYTNTGCPVTGQWIPIAERTFNEFDQEDWIQVTFHTWWPSANDLWYVNNYQRHLPGYDDVITRIEAFYARDQFMGVPSYHFDGHRIGGRVHGGDTPESFTGEVREYIGERLETQTPIQIGIEATVEGDMLNSTVTVFSEENLSNLRLFVSLAEKYVRLPGQPSRQIDFWGNHLDMIPDQHGTDFRIPEGQSASFSFETSLDVGWRENTIDNLKLVAWVQMTDEEQERTVLQAEVLDLGRDVPTMLIVDATQNQEAGEVVFNAFEQGVLPVASRWVRADSGPVSFDDLSGYQAVLWHSYNNSEDIISIEEEDALMEYMDGGGTVIIACPNLGETNGDGLLYQRYLSVLSNDEDFSEYELHGNAGERAFEGSVVRLGEIDEFGTISGLVPQEGASVVFSFVDGDDVVGIGGVVNVTDRYTALTLSFPIEAISGVGGSDDLNQFMGRICDWVENPNSAPLQPQTSVTGFNLQPIYPNPFNSQATLDITIDVATTVHITLSDLAGRDVIELANGFMSAGNHQITINADNAGLSNGVYFVRCQSEKAVVMQKVLYLR